MRVRLGGAGIAEQRIREVSRSNLRFQDRRVADLEARITEPGSAT
ncbi:hypothetical protein [Streptomyces sp. NPDC059649]